MSSTASSRVIEDVSHSLIAKILAPGSSLPSRSAAPCGVIFPTRTEPGWLPALMVNPKPVFPRSNIIDVSRRFSLVDAWFSRRGSRDTCRRKEPSNFVSRKALASDGGSGNGAERLMDKIREAQERRLGDGVSPCIEK